MTNPNESDMKVTPMVTVSDVRRSLYADAGRERRMVVGHPEIREADDSTILICGYASVTNVPYEVNDWLGSYTET
ncbi:hypothetical protein K0U83_23800, partial [bacterium]|nr:hypothetical protein [bacterium]